MDNLALWKKLEEINILVDEIGKRRLANRLELVALLLRQSKILTEFAEQNDYLLSVLEAHGLVGPDEETITAPSVQ